MSFPRALCLAVTSLAAQVPAHGPAHMLAIVNDSRSHGQVGDNFLSLNEVILLNKRALSESQLSPAEKALILGAGGDVAYATLSFNVVPKITFERDLDLIEDQPHGLVIDGDYGLPVLDIGNTSGIVVSSNFCDISDVAIQGGTVGITINQTDALYGTNIIGVTFQGQSEAGIRVNLLGKGTTALHFTEDRFIDVPTGIQIFDSAAGRTGSIDFADLAISGGQTGIYLQLGPTGTLQTSFEGIDISGAAQGIVFERPDANAIRRLTVSALYLTAKATDTAFSFQGHPVATDELTLRMLDLDGGNHALRVWPLGSEVTVTIDDSRIAGGVEVLGGGELASVRAVEGVRPDGPAGGVLIANARMRDGTLSLGSTGAPVRVTDSILTGVHTTTQGAAPVRIDGSRLEQGSLLGHAAAPLDVRGCYLGGTTVATDVSVAGLLPAAQLGTMDASPLTPALGTTVTLHSDLPPGLFGNWIVGLAEPRPIILQRPLHLYFLLAANLVIPTPVRGQSQIPIQLINNPNFVGLDLVVQLAVQPDPGMIAPPLSLPPGRRLELR
jgi:hypothetical protein